MSRSLLIPRRWPCAQPVLHREFSLRELERMAEALDLIIEAHHARRRYEPEPEMDQGAAVMLQDLVLALADEARARGGWYRVGGVGESA